MSVVARCQPTCHLFGKQLVWLLLFHSNANVAVCSFSPHTAVGFLLMFSHKNNMKNALPTPPNNKHLLRDELPHLVQETGVKD